jgi:hypothetical protein
MIQQYKIPKLHTPEICSKDNFKIYSKNLVNLINNFYDRIYDHIDSEEIIAIENHHKDIIKYKYFKEFYNFIKYQFYIELNNNLYNNGLSFWSKLLGDKVCDYRYKNGKSAGKYCGRTIEITPSHKYGNYRCAKHISKKYYIPKERNIEQDKLCIGYNKYNKRCNKFKKYGDHCIYHFNPYKTIIEDYYEQELVISDEIEYNEIKIFNNIYIDYIKKIYPKNIFKLNIIDNLKKNSIKLICYYNDKNKVENKYTLKKQETICNIINNKQNNSESTLENRINNLNNKITNFTKSFKSITQSISISKLSKEEINKLLKNKITTILVNEDNNINKINNNILDLHNSKKIDTNKLINYYKKIKKIENYISHNKKYLIMKKYNEKRNFYYNEKDISNLLESINLRYEELYEYSDKYNRELLEVFKSDIDQYIIEFYNISDQYKLFI